MLKKSFHVKKLFTTAKAIRFFGKVHGILSALIPSAAQRAYIPRFSRGIQGNSGCCNCVQHDDEIQELFRRTKQF
jgi:hypothetical protein